ncbi:glycosyltransferase, partial [Rubrivirga sp.]|uniref:glycosyltransferase n=1 Tax=Rubrivirga sp. TaxID=1885344 RepID=UPI003C71BBF3
GVPRVVTTRGMLEPWARRHRRLKKAVAWRLYQRRDLASAAVLHATAESEAESLRSVGLRAPIAVIPNGVDVPAQVAPHDRSPGTPRRALFLSRVHPKKGLPQFLEVWSQVRPAGWELLIAGPDEDGHRADLEAQAARLGLTEVRFRGSVPDSEKWNLYRSADLFVLPTYSENFGVVVAEALASGVPVVTTTGTPWSDLRDHGCGWWVAPDARPLRDALEDAVALEDAARAGMGTRGRALVSARYGWPQISAQMADVYAWTLGHAPRPSTVHTD